MMHGAYSVKFIMLLHFYEIPPRNFVDHCHFDEGCNRTVCRWFGSTITRCNFRHFFFCLRPPVNPYSLFSFIRVSAYWYQWQAICPAYTAPTHSPSPHFQEHIRTVPTISLRCMTPLIDIPHDIELFCCCCFVHKIRVEDFSNECHQHTFIIVYIYSIISRKLSEVFIQFLFGWRAFQHVHCTHVFRKQCCNVRAITIYIMFVWRSTIDFHNWYW